MLYVRHKRVYGNATMEEKAMLKIEWTKKDIKDRVPERLRSCLDRCEDDLQQVVLMCLRSYVEDVETNGV